MTQSLMALDTISCWCFWRWWADVCFEASQPDANSNWEMTWPFKTYITKPISESHRLLSDLCSTAVQSSAFIIWRIEKVEVAEAGVGCVSGSCSAPKRWGSFFFSTNSGMGHSLAAEMVAWSIGCTCRDIQWYFCSFSRVRFSFAVFLQVFAWVCATYHSCGKFSIL